VVKVVVTGGAGYVGVPLCRALLERGDDVICVDNFMFGYDPILDLVSFPNFSVVKQDIRHTDYSYLKGADAVIHLAGISGYPACEANPHSAKLINVNATASLAQAMSPDQLFIFASTTSFYGSSGQLSKEDSVINPVSLYGVTKQEGEAIVMDRANSISLRWATVFGVSPRMRAGLLVNDFAEKAVQERTIVLYDSDSMRTFMHLSDVVLGYLFAIDNAGKMAGEIVNMGSSQLNYSKRDIALKIKERQPCEIMEAAIGDTDIRNFLVCFEKAESLGYQCTRTVEQGIDELLKLYRFYAPNSFIKPI
jgi:nucleoside-diphosphate-sugar epimerase|tara:strand:- start:19751 stop:20671 length:921 start_codon:yes stop_codon:yes gene_type:complete